MAKTIEDLFFYLVFIFDVLIIGLIFYLTRKTTIEKTLWFIALYCFVNSAINLSSFLHLPRKVEFFLFGFYTIFEYTVFAYVIFHSIRDQVFRKLIKTFSIFFSVFVICYFSFGRVQGIDSVLIGIETILILIFSFYYFYEQMNDVTSSTYIYHKPSFWIIVGFILYLGGSFFIYIFANHVERPVLDKYWFLTYLFYIIKSILFIIGIMVYVKQSKNPQPARLRPSLN
jgi:hypothetical protein